MKYQSIHNLALLGVGIFAMFLYEEVTAWDTYGYGMYRDPAYESFTTQHNAYMQQLQNNINQVLQGYEQQNSEELKAKYQELQAQGINIPYQTFVQNYLMSSGGRNPQAVINQQRAFTGAMQGANQDLNKAYEGYINSWNENQASKERIQQNWGDATMGYSPYTNPYTGQTTRLPYGPSGYEGGYYTDDTGNYTWTPGGIYQVGPGGMAVPMEDAEFYQNFFGN